jgi:fucose 4-O-acetylase-like acetyltransferase
MLRDYIVPSYSYFSFFPHGAFLAFGVAGGSAIRLLKEEHLGRAMEWTAVIGLALIMLCRYLADLPYSLYANADSQFWLNSPLQILIKQGVILVALALSFAWTRYGWSGRWSLVQQIGSTSLIVYWVHIELVYGRWFGSFKNNLTVGQTVACAVSLIISMVALSVARSNFERIKQFLTARLSASPIRLPFVARFSRTYVGAD